MTRSRHSLNDIYNVLKTPRQQKTGSQSPRLHDAWLGFRVFCPCAWSFVDKLNFFPVMGYGEWRPAFLLLDNLAVI